jgi:hypothetical protein
VQKAKGLPQFNISKFRAVRTPTHAPATTFKEPWPSAGVSLSGQHNLAVSKRKTRSRYHTLQDLGAEPSRALGRRANPPALLDMPKLDGVWSIAIAARP